MCVPSTAQLGYQTHYLSYLPYPNRPMLVIAHYRHCVTLLRGDTIRINIVGVTYLDRHKSLLVSIIFIHSGITRKNSINIELLEKGWNIVILCVLPRMILPALQV